MSIHLRQNPSVLRRTIRMDPPPIMLLFWPEARSCKCHVCWFDFVFLQPFLWGSNWENNVSQDRSSTMRTVDQKFCQQQNNIHYHYYYYTTIIIIIVIMIHICTVCGDVPDQTLRLIQAAGMLSQPWGMDCCCGTVLQQMVLQFYRWWWWWPVENMCVWQVQTQCWCPCVCWAPFKGPVSSQHHSHFTSLYRTPSGQCPVVHAVKYVYPVRELQFLSSVLFWNGLLCKSAVVSSAWRLSSCILSLPV